MTVKGDNARSVELASDFTVGDYLDAVDARDSKVIAEGIHRRFTERYLAPVTDSGAPKESLARKERGGRAANCHGFTMMAISCLMIEALQSFRRGWTDTSQRGQGELAFCTFFDAEDAFALFRGHAHDFYKGVRCGILHQAETTLGWRVRREGELLKENEGVRTINAKKFVLALQEVLDRYRDALKTAAWDDESWVLLRKKMKRVCANCTSNKPVLVGKGGKP